MTTLHQKRHLAFQRQQGCCCYCGLPMWQHSASEITREYSISPGEAKALQCTAEHLVARCDGGNNSAPNIAAACLYCNRRRHARKKPLSPARYAARVRSRVLRDRWHSHTLTRRLPAPRFPIVHAIDLTP